MISDVGFQGSAHPRVLGGIGLYGFEAAEIRRGVRALCNLFVTINGVVDMIRARKEGNKTELQGLHFERKTLLATKDKLVVGSQMNDQQITDLSSPAKILESSISLSNDEKLVLSEELGLYTLEMSLYQLAKEKEKLGARCAQAEKDLVHSHHRVNQLEGAIVEATTKAEEVEE